MKKLFTLVLLFAVCLSFVYSQSNVPNIVSFQGVARDANNNIVADTTISVQLSYTSGLNGTVFFCRQFIQRTDTFGEFTVSITDTAARSTQCGGDSLSLVPWDNGNIYLNVSYESSLAGPFVPLGSIQLGPTYYAFVARQAEELTNFNILNPYNGQTIQFDSTKQKWIPVTPFSPWNDFAVYQQVTPKLGPAPVVPGGQNWSTIALNNTQDSSGTNISRNGSIITLMPGTYYITAYSVCALCNDFTIGLNNGNNFDLTGAMVLGASYGTPYWYNTANMSGIVSVTGSTSYTLQIWAVNTMGVGGDDSYLTNPSSQIFVQKIK